MMAQSIDGGASDAPEREAKSAALGPAAIEAAARHLLNLRAEHKPGSRLASLYRPLEPEDGWRIQRRVGELMASPVLGWKCALPPDDRWIVAALHEVVAPGTHVPAPVGPHGPPRIEPELAFELGQDLQARKEPYSVAEVDAAIGAVRLAVEVLGCRYQRPDECSGPELMADSLWNQAMVLGPPVVEPPDEFAFELTLSVEGEPDRSFSARHPDGDARRPLYWLVEFLRARGVGLKAGQAVITGSLAGVLELPFQRQARLRYGSLGELSLSLGVL